MLCDKCCDRLKRLISSAMGDPVAWSVIDCESPERCDDSLMRMMGFLRIHGRVKDKHVRDLERQACERLRTQT